MCRLARAKVRIARDRKATIFIKTLFTSSCVRDRNCKEILENSRIENRIRVSRNFEKKKIVRLIVVSFEAKAEVGRKVTVMDRTGITG